MKPYVFKNTILLGVFFIAQLSHTQAHAQQWNEGEDPGKFLYSDERLETNFDLLKTSSRVTTGGGPAPWSETFWPAKQGGIAVRYYHHSEPGDAAFSAKHYSLVELRNLKPDQLKGLSPAEKFDILKSNYDYPLTNKVLKTYSKESPFWWGICHGWVPASINYPEPEPVTVKNKDGITIEFGSSDVKALISYYYAWEVAAVDQVGNQNWGFKTDSVDPSKQVYFQRDPQMVYFIYRQLGNRCNRDGFHPNCKGSNMNPAAFHLAIANLVGRYHRSFVVNVDPTNQVWNQPVLGYDSEVLATRKLKRADEASHEAVEKILVSTTLWYVLEGYPTFESNEHVYKETKQLLYWLELDKDHNIVGGSWSDGFLRKKDKRTEYIGFAWRASRVPFLGEFQVLNQLYKSKIDFVNAYAASRNYTPGLRDMYFEVNSSQIPTYNW